MKKAAQVLAFVICLLPSLAVAQSTPATLPFHSVYGRIGQQPGDTGPGQAIPWTTLLPNLAGAQSANKVWAGPASGGVAIPIFRALVGADLPGPGASTLGGVQGLTCATSNWFSTLSTSGVFGCSQPNFTDLAGLIAAGQIPNSTITGAKLTASAAVALSQIAAQANNTFVGNVSGSAAVPVALTPGQVGGALCVPVRNILITGSALTYTAPTCNGVTATWLEVEVQGGGGGGAGSGTTTPAGTVGNASLFGTLTANGGGAGSGGVPGTGGTCSGSLGAPQNFPGSAGGGSNINAATAAPGGNGGVGFYGGYGPGGVNGVAGTAAPANTGGGGGGGGGALTAGVIAGVSGGAGCHISTVITSPAATYIYTVGGTAVGGSAGASGFAGGTGASGLITALAHWQ